MGFFYIFFILVCGFVVANYHLPARFKQNRSIGWDYYFRIALLGFVCLLTGLLITALVDAIDAPSWVLAWLSLTPHDLSAAWLSFGLEQVTPHQLAVAVFAFVTALVFAGYSYSRARNPVFRISQLVSECSGHHLEKLLLDAIIFDMSVSVTLKSRKWYAGKVIDFTPETGGLRTFALLPTRSGYRREKDLELVDTQNYEAYYHYMGVKDGSHGRLNLEHFRVVVPLENVSHIAMFDPETYTVFSSAEGIRD